MTLYGISEGNSATQVGKQTKRNPERLMKLVHRRCGLHNLKGLLTIQIKIFFAD